MSDTDWERFAPGNVFANRYTIIEEIGHGGMGRVFKAIDRSLGITVAIKIIGPEHASNPRVVALFKQETVLARSISSENVVRVHDLGEAENTKYISMDFVEGQNLRDLIFSSGSLTISTAVKFGQQVCSGLAAAHKQGIIHRDLKPSNIMIDKTGRVRVMDFGLAMTIDREDAKGVRAIVGTPEYLSPEQARGEEVDRRADIYAFGLILYEMVTGRPVFEAESLTGYIQKHCEVIPEPPSRRNQLVPAALDAIILRCLKKDRNERYQTVEEVCQALDRVVAPEARQRKTARSRLPRYSAGAAACVLLGFIAYFVFFPPPRRPVPIRKIVALMEFENVIHDPTQDKWRAIRSLLSRNLEQSVFLQLIAPSVIRQYLNDFKIDDTGEYRQEVLDRIASQEKVDYFILGGYMPSGAGCQVDIRIMDARTRQNVGVRSFDIPAYDEFQSRGNDIALWAKQNLGLSKQDIENDPGEELKKYNQPPEAVMQFFRGIDLYEKGDYAGSSECFRRAVEIDKTFALAYVRLALNATYESRIDEAKENLVKAWSLRKKLTPRERLLVEGDYLNFYESDYPRAIEKYRALLRSYPNDPIALEHQGAILRNIEEWAAAKECFEQLLAIQPKKKLIIDNLSFIAQAMGNYEEAVRLLQDNKSLFSSTDEFQRELAKCFLCQGRTDQALIELDKGESLYAAVPIYRQFRGHIQTLMGNYKDAENTYRELLEEEGADYKDLYDRFWLGHLYLLRGQYNDCSREIEAGLRSARKSGFSDEELQFLLFKSHFHISQEDFVSAYETAAKARQKAQEVRYREMEVEALHLMGLSQVGLGKFSEARGTGLVLEQLISKMGYPKLLRSGFHLEGMIAAAQGSWDRAVNAFSKAVETLSYQRSEYLDRQAVYYESLASALFRRGDLDSAQAQYEKVISLTVGRLTAGDAYARSLLQLGKICQEKNELSTAKEFFRRYLAVRGDADAGLAEVKDARKRLASLS